jgi:leucyl-tRNA synthetase
MQRDWIGRSEGARVRFEVPGHEGAAIEVFTTRPDTLFGATYMVLAPEHPLVERITAPERQAAVREYVVRSTRRSERVRMADAAEKTGVDTGARAINPASGSEIPVWIADYVLAGYGTGAIMAVPGHDQRDHAFARRFDLPIVEVVAGGDVSQQAYTADGVAINSGFLDGLPTGDAKRRMNAWLEKQGCGQATVTYKLRDWLFSRQRYWGEPFPVLHARDGSTRLVPESDLPLTLPRLDDYKPTGQDFEAPLARVEEWIETRDPESGEPLRRDPNTMPQWAGSCWYFLRFLDPHNDREPWSLEAERYWMPVDLYVGGAEHAVLHLLYARFWHKVFFDLGLVHTKEPFQRLVNQGMILGESFRYYDDNVSDGPGGASRVLSFDAVEQTDEGPVARDDGTALKARWLAQKDVVVDPEAGTPRHPQHPQLVLERVIEKMSKSRGNVVNPDEVIASYGADSMRLYEMFIGPLEKSAPWSTEGILGIYRFLQRSWRLLIDEGEEGAEERLRSLEEGAGTIEQARLTARTIDGVSQDIEAMRFNTAISKLMVFVRDITKDAPLPWQSAETLLLLLAPMAPHLAEELWQRLGHTESLAYAPWPVADPALLVEDEISLVVQVNGKKRDEILVPKSADARAIEALALASDKIRAHLGGREPKKVIVVPGRLVNLVI